MAKGKKHNKKDHGGKGNRRRGGQKSLKLSSTAGNLDSQLRDLNLCTKDISGDGNCLFRALSDQFHGYDTNHATIRHDICEFLRENEEEYQFFVEDDQSLDHHLECMERDGTYGGNMELAAFARLRQVDIKVYQPGLIYIIRGISEMEESERTLHIAYHSWEHYSSVRNIDGPFSGLPEVKVQESQSKKKEEDEDEGEDGNDLLDSKEKAILAACPDATIRKIRRLLRKHKGDTDKVIEVLYDIPIDEPEENKPQEPTDPSITTITTTTTASTQVDEKENSSSTTTTNDQQQKEKDDNSSSSTEQKDIASQEAPTRETEEETEKPSVTTLPSPPPSSTLDTPSNSNEKHTKTDIDSKDENDLEEKGAEEKENKPPTTTTTPKNKPKPKKKMTKRQKKLLQKENRKAKWLQENNRQHEEEDETTKTVKKGMKEMYI